MVETKTNRIDQSNAMASDELKDRFNLAKWIISFTSLRTKRSGTMSSSLHSIRWRTLGLILLALATLGMSSSNAIQGQQEPAQGKQTAQPIAPNQAIHTLRDSTVIDLKIETFQNQIVPSKNLGAMADITNNSNSPIYLREPDVQLVLPPEYARTSGYSWDGFFPTQWYEAEPRVLCLQANETYRIFWNPDVQSQQSTSSWFQRYFEFIGFIPGAYPITAEVKYWDQRKFDGDDYHVAVASKIVEFAAPQRIILLGAVLGGLIFMVLAMVRAEQSPRNGGPAGRLDTAKSWGKKIATLVGSILMSVIVTILLSRISETQFFIKVTVSDLWGAIAVGFLANYGGWALLDKMVPPGGGRGQNEKQTQTKAESADAAKSSEQKAG